MQVLSEIFSTRELALIIWLIILLLVLVLWNDGRYHLKEIIKSAFAPKFLISNISFILYITLIVAVLSRWKLWDISLLKDTAIWYLFSALGILYSVHKARKNSYFWRLLKSSITVTVFIEFLINLYPFSLLTELITLPFLIFLVILNVYFEHSAKTNTEHINASSCLTKVVGIAGLFYISFALYKTIVEYENVFSIEVLKQFLLPILLTTLAIPYFWGLALYMKFENMFVYNNALFRDKSKIDRLKIKFLVLFYGNFSFERIHRIWRKLGLLVYEEDVSYRKYIKQVASAPAYKRSPIINKMSIEIFNDIDACCKSLSSLELGEFSEWDKSSGCEDFYCSTGYHQIEPYGLSDLLLSLQGEELHIHQLELTLSIYNPKEREESISRFKKCIESILRLLSLEVPLSVYDSISKSRNFNYSNNKFSIDFTFEISGRVELFNLLIKSN